MKTMLKSECCLNDADNQIRPQVDREITGEKLCEDACMAQTRWSGD